VKVYVLIYDDEDGIHDVFVHSSPTRAARQLVREGSKTVWIDPDGQRLVVWYGPSSRSYSIYEREVDE